MSRPLLATRDALMARVEHLCEVMHDAYEEAAAGAGWETQEASRKPWSDVPEANRVTMRAAVSAMIDDLLASGVVRDPSTLVAAARYSECHEGVSRRGELQPCEKPAIALRYDPTEGTPYPVCSRHARADMVPLTALAAALTEDRPC